MIDTNKHQTIKKIYWHKNTNLTIVITNTETHWTNVSMLSFQNKLWIYGLCLSCKCEKSAFVAMLHFYIASIFDKNIIITSSDCEEEKPHW